jgi:hypothetical protein
MSHWESEYVVCPYYHRHETDKDNIFQITCEGLDNSASLVVKFSTAKARTNYTEEHCNDLKGCKGCVVHQALNLKYGVLNEL